ncbi:MAG: helix-turn-helix domain-containing protein [Candidatus Nitrosocaldus sp.]
MSISAEDVIFMLISYIAGMFVTSLTINRNVHSRKSVDINGVYEHVIADLMARIDVIDLRMKRIDGITRSLYSKGSQSKELDGKEEDDDGMSMIDPKYVSNCTKSDNNYDAISMASDDDGNSKERQSGAMITVKEHDEVRKGMDDGRLAIISSNRDSYKSVADDDRKEEGRGGGVIVSKYVNNEEGNVSTIEKVLHMIVEEGPKTSREIEQRLGMSREHTARLMKRLYDMGYVIRDESKRPYRYMLAEYNHPVSK